MLNAKDCLARASEMERRAGACGSAILEADLLSMAETWRYLAQQALWQDSFVQTVQDSGRDWA
jgi:hypothetical protein